jgi:hypothetical protein
MLASVLRDAEVHELTREINTMRAAGPMKEMRNALADGLSGRRRLALLDLALDFRTWRRLTESGLDSAEAAATMAATVFAV